MCSSHWQSAQDVCRGLSAIGQWIGKVFVLATSKTMSPHDDMAAEQLILRVEGGKSLAFVSGYELLEYGIALGVEILRDLLPIERLNALLSRQD